MWLTQDSPHIAQCASLCPRNKLDFTLAKPVPMPVDGMTRMASITQRKQHHFFLHSWRWKTVQVQVFILFMNPYLPRRCVARLKNPCSCCLKGRTNRLLQPNIPCCFWANTIVGDGSGQTQRMLNGFQSTTTCHWSDLLPQARARYHRLGKISKDCHPLGQKPRETIPR